MLTLKYNFNVFKIKFLHLEISFIEGDETILSDEFANSLAYTTQSGIVTVNGETPPDIFAPENLSAVGNFQSINLSWNHPDALNMASALRWN